MAQSDPSLSLSYPIVDTGQGRHYGAVWSLPSPPAEGTAFFGQDAAYDGHQPQYQDNGDGTVTDLVTGLMWQQTPVSDITWDEAVAGAETADTAGYDDWRLPSIKELYSLILFSGDTGFSAETSTPYIDASVFGFSYGNEAAGERMIDAQYWSATEYLGTTINGAATAFGVNFADGRIKGYPTAHKTADVLYVRGNEDYGNNAFIDNGDGTITDAATGLMWMATDSGFGMTWEDALAYAEDLEAAGHDDWRLPNAKELQSIVDYDRAPDPVLATQDTTGPAIDPLFSLTNIGSAAEPDYPYVWTGTTHVEGGQGGSAVYIAFGQAWGVFQDPWTGETTHQDVHGAGAQRSDPKTGEAEDYPTGRGPQGDDVRIENYVIAVRDLTEEEILGLDTPSDDAQTAAASDIGSGWRPVWEDSLRAAITLHGQDAVAEWLEARGIEAGGLRALDWLEGG